MKRNNYPDPATKTDIVRFVKLLIDEALDHEFDRGDFEEEMVLESRIRETVGEREFNRIYHETFDLADEIRRCSAPAIVPESRDTSYVYGLF